jgi:hypothetical protein
MHSWVGPSLAILQRTSVDIFGKRPLVVLYVLMMVAIVVGVDVAFLSHHFLARLLINIGIVLVFIAFYFSLVKRR